MHLFLRLLWLFAFFVPQLALAGPYTDIANSIPRNNERGAAKDLFFKGPLTGDSDLECLDGDFPQGGRAISKDEAECLNADLSELNPAPQVVWNSDSNAFNSDFYTSIPEFTAHDGETFSYISGELSGSRNSKHFIQSSTGQHYRLKISKYAHNVLLRAKLLEKLGYFVQPVKHFKKIKLQFSLENSDLANRNALKKFVKVLRSDVSGAPDRWITNIVKEKKDPSEAEIETLMKLGLTREEAITKIASKIEDFDTEWDLDPQSSAGKNTLELQDVILYLEKDYVTDVAAGFYDEPYVAGRRHLNALLVPYSLTDVPESLNKFSCDAGSIVNNGISLPYSNDLTGQLKPSWDDAKWIVRKILSLKKQDWAEVAAAADYPEVDGSNPVKMLATEKLICRRNWLKNVFFAKDRQFKKLKENTKITDKKSNRLVNGILYRFPKGDKRNDEEHPPWEGSGSRFSIGSQDSPLSFGEIFAYGRSLIFSSAIANLVSTANKELALNSKEKNQEDALQNQHEQNNERILNYFKTGKMQKNELGTWTTPLYGAELILSRDQIIGSYLGSENNIQIADTFGYALNAGYLVGLNGMPDNVTAGITARTNYVVRYTHIRPIASFKKAVKEYGEWDSIKNIAVTLYMNRAADLLGDLVDENNLNPYIINLCDACKDETLKALAKEKAKLESVTTRNCEDYVDKIQEQESQSLVSNAINAINNMVSSDEERRTEEIKKCEEEVKEYKEKLVEFTTDNGEKLKELVKAKETFSNLKRTKINLILQEFHENFQQGESLIITRSLGGSLGINASYAIDVRNQYRTRFEKGLKDISRLHIIKRSDTAIQVYKNDVLVHTYNVDFNYSKYFFPIFSASFSGMNSLGGPKKTQTQFFEIDLPESLSLNANSDGYSDNSGGDESFQSGDSVDDSEMADIGTKVRAIQALFKHQDTELLEDMQDPIVVQHNLEMDDSRIKFFWKEWYDKDSYDYITVKNPRVSFDEFNTAEYIRGSSGSRSGNDYQSLVTDGLQAYFDYNKIDNIKFDVATSNNPGDTYEGNSYFSRATFDARIPRADSQNPLEKPIVDMTFRWKGWKISQKKAEELIDTINTKFGFNIDLNKKLNEGNPIGATLSDPVTTGEVYNAENILFDVEDIQLYRIDVNVYIYNEGLAFFFGLPSFNSMGRKITDEQFRAYLKQYGTFPVSSLPMAKQKGDSIASRKNRLLDGLVKIRRNIRENILNKNYEDVATSIPSFFERMSSYLTITHITHLVGGTENIFVRSTIDGYKQGSENEDKTIFGYTLNKIGELDRKGPISAVISDLKVKENSIAENEFFMIWLMGQL